jgi:hypothetical protein
MKSLPLLTEDDLIALGLENPAHRHMLLANTGRVPLEVLNDATNLQLAQREQQRQARKAAKRARRVELELALALSASLVESHHTSQLDCLNGTTVPHSVVDHVVDPHQGEKEAAFLLDCGLPASLADFRQHSQQLGCLPSGTEPPSMRDLRREEKEVACPPDCALPACHEGALRGKGGANHRAQGVPDSSVVDYLPAEQQAAFPLDCARPGTAMDRTCERQGVMPYQEAILSDQDEKVLACLPGSTQPVPDYVQRGLPSVLNNVPDYVQHGLPSVLNNGDLPTLQTVTQSSSSSPPGMQPEQALPDCANHSLPSLSNAQKPLQRAASLRDATQSSSETGLGFGVRPAPPQDGIHRAVLGSAASWGERTLLGDASLEMRELEKEQGPMSQSVERKASTVAATCATGEPHGSGMATDFMAVVGDLGRVHQLARALAYRQCWRFM